MLYEPVVGNKHWNVNGQLYYPGVPGSSRDVKDLLLLIAKEQIKEENKLEPYCDIFESVDLTVTFVTKNRRIWVDQAEV